MNVSRLLTLEGPLDCEVVARINRFVVGVRMGRKACRASINNTGRLEQFLVRGRRAYCIRHTRPKKTDYRLFAIGDGESAAIIDTQMQMRAFEKALEMANIPWLDGTRILRRNVRLGNSLIDYLLARNGERVYLEVKSAVLREDTWAMYPDCPTARGRKHVLELASHVRNGGKGTILFIAALPDVRRFKPYFSGDPELCSLLIEANRAGVGVRAIGMTYRPEDQAVYLTDPDMGVDVTGGS